MPNVVMQSPHHRAKPAFGLRHRPALASRSCCFECPLHASHHGMGRPLGHTLLPLTGESTAADRGEEQR
jgi:hypothetical protein